MFSCIIDYRCLHWMLVRCIPTTQPAPFNFVSWSSLAKAPSRWSLAGGTIIVLTSNIYIIYFWKHISHSFSTYKYLLYIFFLISFNIVVDIVSKLCLFYTLVHLYRILMAFSRTFTATSLLLSLVLLHMAEAHQTVEFASSDLSF